MHRHRAGLGIERSVDAVLPGEPQDAVLAEARRVEVGGVVRVGQGIGLHVEGGWIHPHDGIEAAIRYPRRTVRTDDDTMRRGAIAQRHLLDLAALGIEPPERTLALSGIP